VRWWQERGATSNLLQILDELAVDLNTAGDEELAGLIMGHIETGQIRSARAIEQHEQILARLEDTTDGIKWLERGSAFNEDELVDHVTHQLGLPIQRFAEQTTND
jgi:hypothetical protein